MTTSNDSLLDTKSRLLRNLLKDGEAVTLVLPFKMPTLNDWQTYHFIQRSKIKNFIEECICACITSGEGSPILTISAQKLSSMGFDVEKYYRMIQRSSSANSRRRKAKLNDGTERTEIRIVPVLEK